MVNKYKRKENVMPRYKKSGKSRKRANEAWVIRNPKTKGRYDFPADPVEGSELNPDVVVSEKPTYNNKHTLNRK